MNRTEKRFFSVLAAVVVLEGVVLGVGHFTREQPAASNSNNGPPLTREQELELQFPPPEVVSVQFGPPGQKKTIKRFPANASVTDFPMLDVPQHVPLNGILPPTRRERSYSYSTNSAGVRGSREYTPEPAEGVFRIGVIGTGVAFGLGVSDEEVFTARLESMLAENPHDRRKFEVLNFGLPGMCAKEAVNIISYWSSVFRCDLWLVMFGVNDSLPCYKVTLTTYAFYWKKLIAELRSLDGQVILAIEPLNTFYPWLHRYKRFDRLMRQLVGNSFRIIDFASYLDGFERQDGLRLEMGNGKLELARYDGGERHVEFEQAWEKPQGLEPWVPAEVFEFLDNSDLRLRTFLSDVHLNEYGHELLAIALYDVVGAVLKGEIPQVATCPECRVVEPGL